MKKKLLLFLIFFINLLFLKEVTAQDCYTVMKIKGVILLESTGNQLNAGEQICSDDNLIFNTADAVAIVHSSSKGRYTIKPVKNRSNELESVIKESVASALSKSKANLETRGYSDLKKEFGDSYCVIGEGSVGIDELDYPVDAKKYFIIRYSYRGKEVEKKLPFSNNEIILEKNFIYTTEGNPVDREKVNPVSLYYRDDSLKKQTAVAAFSLRFLETSELKPEAEEFIKNMKSAGKETEEIKTELYLYLYDVYGKINTDNYYSWIKYNFGL